MKKLKAILNLSKASVDEVKGKANLIVQKMTGNTTFPTPVPPLANIVTQVTVVSTKQAEQAAAFQTYQQKSLEVGIEKDNLMNILEDEANYVDLISNGNETRIVSAGYDVRQASTPVGEMPAPINVLATEGSRAGEILVSWKTVKGAKAYNIEQSADISDDSSWEHALTVTKAKGTIAGLGSGTRIWVRVSAVGAIGAGAFSDVSTRIVP